MDNKGALGRAHAGFLGSLRDALAAAGRDDTGSSNRLVMAKAAAPTPPPLPVIALSAPADATQLMAKDQPQPSAAQAAREARGGTPHVPPLSRAAVAVAVGDDDAPTTRVVRGGTPARAEAAAREGRTQIVRGKQTVARGTFEQDPVVGWLVIVGGPGLGAFRAIYEGNNTVGRAPGQRVALDFGDDTISAEEQAYIRYDSAERGFLFVPNLAKTNIVSVNGKRPTTAVPLAAMDVIHMGRTQLVFVPFCGADFDWAELSDKQS
jgi:hypothetical protein